MTDTAKRLAQFLQWAMVGGPWDGYNLDGGAVQEKAHALGQIEQAIAVWRRCLETNSWPGYPLETVELEWPPWHEQRLMDKEIQQAGRARKALTKEQFALADQAQRP